MRASPGGRGGVRPPPRRGSGAQDPRPTEDPALPAHAGQPGLSADGNGRLLGRGDPGSALVREVAGTAGGPVCRAPLRWGSDLAPCPPQPPGDPAPASENTEQVPVDSRRPPQGTPRTGGDSMPRPPGGAGALLCSSRVGGGPAAPPGQTGSAPIYLPVPAWAEAAESPREPGRASRPGLGFPGTGRRFSQAGPASGGRGRGRRRPQRLK